RPRTRTVDLIVEPREVEAERLRRRAVRLRLDVLRIRREPVRRLRADEVRRVDHGLAVPAAHRLERLDDGATGHREQDDVCVGDVASVPADAGDLVPRALPAVGEPAADVAFPNHRDLHGPPLARFRNYSCAQYAFAAVARDYPSVLELVGDTPIVRLHT